jgi:glycosyltransferase involved in cell wall biosynthesis/peptidoglycan/xylan/chitin deacetylase (PgdA/CDA1 family)
MSGRRPRLDAGAFLLSLDTELAWGSVPGGTYRERAPLFERTRPVVRRLLDLMESYEIRATWAVVGHLFLEACAPVGGRKHPEVVRPDYDWFEGDWFAADPCTSWREAPAWYAPDLVDMVLASGEGMEIGCHTFSHVLAGDPSCGREAFESELDACLEVAGRRGLELRSFVYPRNEIGHLASLRDRGFRCYRGSARPDRTRAPGALGKVARGVQWTTPLPPLTARPERTKGLWNLPATTFYLHRDGPARRIPVGMRVWRARKGIEEAIAEKSLFHLYFHPFNLATDPDGLLGGLEEIFREVADRRARGEIRNPTMGSLAAELDRTRGDAGTDAAAGSSSTPRVSSRSPRRPRVLVVGGADVDKRLGLVRELGERFSVTVAGPGPEHRARFEAAGFAYHDYPLTRGASPLSDLGTLTHLTRLVRRMRPDIVHAFATKPAVWARIAARLGSDAVVVGTLPGRGSLFWASGPWVRLLRGIYRTLQTVACRSSDLTIFYNESDARVFIESGVVRPAEAAIVPGSGIPTGEFDPEEVPAGARDGIREEFGVSRDDVLVTMVARAIRTKGVMEYAEAADRLTSELPGVRFLLVGADDPRSVDRLDRAERARVGNTTVWPGHRTDVREILAASDVFVLPSYGEGIPRALMEAGSMGLPSVTTDVPGCRDVVEDDRNGILVPPRDAEALTEALRSLIADPERRRRLGTEARRVAVERFDTRAIADEIASLYWRLLDNRPGRWSRPGTEEDAGIPRDPSPVRASTAR